MNFDAQTPVDVLLGRLLAFVVMFEKKIELLKCKLAGSEQFHTRLAFQNLDHHRKNEVSPDSIGRALRGAGMGQVEGECQLLTQKYSRKGSFTYEEFLRLLTPKNNKALAQRLMIRTVTRGATLEDYLFRHTLDLLGLYAKMTAITEGIRKAIQHNDDLTHLELIQFFHKTIDSPRALVAFLNRCAAEAGDEEYDVTQSDAVYLGNHLTSGNEIGDFSDLDVRELVCPLDMNQQKAVLTGKSFYPVSVPAQSTNFSQTQQTNFLSKTYQKMYKEPVVDKPARKENLPIYNNVIINQREQLPSRDSTPRVAYNSNSPQQGGYGNLYIDNFTRSGLRASGIDPSHYAGHSQGQSHVEYFHDDLSNNSSASRLSGGSAFDRS